MGNLSFYLFFCAVGAMINVKMAIVLSPILFIYVMIMVVVHLVSVYGIGRLFRLDIRVLTIASAAAKTGAALGDRAGQRARLEDAGPAGSGDGPAGGTRWGTTSASAPRTR